MAYSTEVTITFDDVAVYFSEEEWTSLEDWQKALYINVTKDNYQTLQSLGLNTEKPDLIKKIERGEDPCFSKRCEIDETNITRVIVEGDGLFDEEIGCHFFEDSANSNDVALPKDQHKSLQYSNTSHSVAAGHGVAELPNCDGGTSGQIAQNTFLGKPMEKTVTAESNRILAKKATQEIKAYRKDGKFICNGCGKNFRHRSHCIAHERIHTGEKPFSCLKCGKAFRWLSQWKNHRTRVCFSVLENNTVLPEVKRGIHSVEEPKKSPNTAENPFGVRSQITRDEQSAKTRKTACATVGGFCDTTIRTPDLRYQMPAPLAMASSKPFLYKSQRINEQLCQMENKNPTTLYPCKDPRNNFQQNSQAVKHTYHTEDLEEFQDHGENFIHHSDLDVHKRFHAGERTLACPESGYGFVTQQGLNAHQNCHADVLQVEDLDTEHQRTKRDEMPFVSYSGAKKFSRGLDYIAHEKSQSGENSFACSECGKAFSGIAPWRIHMKCHTEELPLVCTDCGKHYTLISDFYAHRKTHSKQLLSGTEEEFECCECGECFLHKNGLISHQRYCTRTHKCSQCAERFHHKLGLEKHLKTHTPLEKASNIHPLTAGPLQPTLSDLVDGRTSSSSMSDNLEISALFPDAAARAEMSHEELRIDPVALVLPGQAPEDRSVKEHHAEDTHLKQLPTENSDVNQNSPVSSSLKQLLPDGCSMKTPPPADSDLKQQASGDCNLKLQPPVNCHLKQQPMDGSYLKQQPPGGSYQQPHQLGCSESMQQQPKDSVLKQPPENPDLKQQPPENPDLKQQPPENPDLKQQSSENFDMKQQLPRDSVPKQQKIFDSNMLLRNENCELQVECENALEHPDEEVGDTTDAGASFVNDLSTHTIDHKMRNQSSSVTDLVSNCPSTPALLIQTGIQVAESLYPGTQAWEGSASERSLALQYESSGGGETFICCECGESFQEGSHLIAHEKFHRAQLGDSNHERAKPFRCKKCGEGFQWQSEWAEHQKSHLVERTVLCTECGENIPYTYCPLDYQGPNPQDDMSPDSGQRSIEYLYLLKHLKTCTSKPFTCADCGKSFKLEESLVLHQKRSHTGEQPYSCPICGMSFARRQLFRTHYKMHQGEQPFVCDHCGKSFRGIHSFSKHQRIHTELGDNNAKEMVVTITEDSSPSVMQNCENLEGWNGETYHSQMNSRSETLKSTGHLLMNGSAEEQYSGGHPVPLESCNALSGAFISSASLVNSGAQTGPSWQNSEWQSGCLADEQDESNTYETVSQTQTGAEPHQATEHWQNPYNNGHFPEGEGSHADGFPFGCGWCGKSFLWKSHLIAHERIHTGERPFLCEECGERFRWRSQWSAHQKSHTGEKAIRCTECGQSFYHRYALLKHQCVNALENTSPCSDGDTSSIDCLNPYSSKMPFQCNECDKSFKLQESLIIHQKRSHTGEKPYTCPKCDMSFCRRHQFRTHYKLHKEEQPFLCVLCGSRFKGKMYLLKHQKIHEAEMLHTANHRTVPFAQEESMGFGTRQMQLSAHQLNTYPLAVPLSTDQMTARMEQEHSGIHSVKDWPCESSQQSKDEMFQQSESGQYQAVNFFYSDEIQRESLGNGIGFDGRFNNQTSVDSCQRTLVIDKLHTASDYEQDFHKETQLMNPETQTASILHSFKEIERTDSHSMVIELQHKLGERKENEGLRSHGMELPLQMLKNDFTETATEGNKNTLAEKTRKRPRRFYTGGGPFVCSGCGKTFRWKSHFIAHERIHTGEKPFSCGECDKSFRWSSQWIDHLRSHSGERTHICTVCGESFHHGYALQKHQRIHSQVNKTQCPSADQISDHSHCSSDRQTLAREKPYACTDCGKRFKLRDSLVIHLRRVHTGERPYICTKCEKSFLRRHQLRDHHKMHRGERTFPCIQCGQYFRGRSQLIGHLRTHTAEDPKSRPADMLSKGEMRDFKERSRGPCKDELLKHLENINTTGSAIVVKYANNMQPWRSAIKQEHQEIISAEVNMIPQYSEESSNCRPLINSLEQPQAAEGNDQEECGERDPLGQPQAPEGNDAEECGERDPLGQPHMPEGDDQEKCYQRDSLVQAQAPEGNDQEEFGERDLLGQPQALEGNDQEECGECDALGQPQAAEGNDQEECGECDALGQPQASEVYDQDECDECESLGQPQAPEGNDAEECGEHDPLGQPQPPEGNDQEECGEWDAIGQPQASEGNDHEECSQHDSLGQPQEPEQNNQEIYGEHDSLGQPQASEGNDQKEWSQHENICQVNTLDSRSQVSIHCRKNVVKGSIKPQRLHAGNGPFVCSGCGKRFQWRSHFIAHERIHTGEKPFTCSECGRNFRWSSQWVEHQRSHTGEKPYVCTDCGKCFNRSCDLSNHKRIHTGERPYKCGCGKSFIAKKRLIMHQNVHAEERKQACKVCGETFNHSYALLNHQKVHGKGNSLRVSRCEDSSRVVKQLENMPYICSECGQTFKLQASLIIHQQRNHSGARLFSCTRCEKSFTRMHNLRTHFKTHHKGQTLQQTQSGKNPNVRLSRICQYPRLRRKPLSTSVTSNEVDGRVPQKQQDTASLSDDGLTKKGEEKHMANYPVRLEPLRPSLDFTSVSACINETSKGPGDIERQEEVDSPSRCQEAFQNQPALQQHTQAGGDPQRNTGSWVNPLKKACLTDKIHSGDGPPYICNGCGKIFQWRSHFIAHERIHTGEKPFTCSECGKSFRWSSQWNDHRKCHTGEKLYTCMECGKTFSESSELATHKKVHVAEQLYTCDDCGKRFTLKQRLTMHQRCHIRKKQ